MQCVIDRKVYFQKEHLMVSIVDVMLMHVYLLLLVVNYKYNIAK